MLHILLTPAGVRNAFLFPVLGNGPAGDGYAAFCQLFTQKAVAVRLLFVFFLYDLPKHTLDVCGSHGLGTAFTAAAFLDSHTAREEKVHGVYTPGALKVFLADSSADCGFVDVQFLGDICQP